MKKTKTNPYLFSTVTFPEPWDTIRRPGVRLCLGEPVEVLTAISRFCIPVYTLSVDSELTDLVKSYAHYFHTIKGTGRPDVIISYLSIPRFVFALRSDAFFRSFVFASPIRISEG